MITEADRAELGNYVLAAARAESKNEALATIQTWKTAHEQATKARLDATAEAIVDAAISAGRIDSSARDAYIAHGAVVGPKMLGEQLAKLASTKMQAAEQLITNAVGELRLEPSKRDLFTRVAAATDPGDFAEVVASLKPRVNGPGSAPRPRTIDSAAVDAELAANLRRAGLTEDDFRAHGPTDDEAA